jgi:hypothetical protein
MVQFFFKNKMVELNDLQILNIYLTFSTAKYDIKALITRYLSFSEKKLKLNSIYHKIHEFWTFY